MIFKAKLSNNKKTITSLLSIIALLLPTLASANQVLKVCHEVTDLKPIIYKENNEAKGLIITLLKTAASELGVDLQFHAKPWNRCQKEVLTGKSHTLFGMIKTPERAKQFAFPKNDNEYLWTAQYPVFVRSNVEFNSNEYKPDKGIGAPLGYVVSRQLNEKAWLSPFQYKPVEGLKMVAQEKLDGYVIERLIGLNLVYENRLEERVAPSNENLMNAEWHLPFNKSFYFRNKNLVNNLWSRVNKERKHLEKRFRQH